MRLYGLLSLAWVAGLVSFTSPCALPLLPGYVAYVSGLRLPATGEHLAGRERRRIVGAAALFVLGFSLVFTALGATASALGALIAFVVFHPPVTALESADLAIVPDEFVTILGPSGCGKSTLLFAIAGLIKPTDGRVTVNGRAVTGPGADRGVVFQDYALLPWRTVRQNISVGLKIKGVDKARRRAVEDEYIHLFGLDGFGDRYPHELSGGMRQRVAVARTLANTPDVALMDEPFAAVDAQTRAVLGEQLARISATHKMTVAFVTHSVEEAVLLGDRVVVMTPRPGRVSTVLDVPVARGERSLTSLHDNPILSDLTRQATKLLKSMRHCSTESR